jgi:serine/threonine-protein kinase RsbW
MIGAVETEFACTLSDRHAAFRAMMDNAETFLAKQEIPAAVIGKMMIAVDEIVSNIFAHGARDGEPTVSVRLHVGPDRVSAEIVDDGIAFDPLQNTGPDTGLSVEERPIGGLGIHLVRKMMDDARYDRDHGQNRLRFHKRFALEGPHEGPESP